jgi:PPOX class probable FMN-dependent enzyme
MSHKLSELKRRFRDVVATEVELRAIVGQPHQRALDKEMSVIDDVSRRFIVQAPFVFVASSGEEGMLDISPKGDPAGFVEVLDEHTLAIPDRLGNRRLDTFCNVLRNSNVALIFIIPGITYTLRVSGNAIIVRDAELRARMAVNRKEPDHILVVGVTKVYSHCPKCMIRSGMWEPRRWPDTTTLPSFAETLIAHAKLNESLETVAAMLDAGNRDRLY